jgi:hypothetical protein
MQVVSLKMRIKVTTAILIIAVAFFAANLLTGARTLSQAELENVTAVCLWCHGQVPEYDFASRVHNRHAAFDCSLCHGEAGGLRTADSIHTGLKWLGIGLVSLALSGITGAYLAGSRKDRAI